MTIMCTAGQGPFRVGCEAEPGISALVLAQSLSVHASHDLVHGIYDLYRLRTAVSQEPPKAFTEMSIVTTATGPIRKKRKKRKY